MPANPDDPRVKKTRRSLREAFIRLILRTGYDAISIQDIATEAQTARITFYRHYHDKEALLIDCLNVLYEELIEQTAHISPEGLAAGYTPVRVFYEHLEAQEPLYRILFSSRGTQVVVERLRHHLAARVMEAIQGRFDRAQLKVPVEIIAYHAAGAQIGLAVWWMDHGKPYSPDYMAQVAQWLSLVGVLQAVGLRDFTPPAPQPPST